MRHINMLSLCVNYSFGFCITEKFIISQKKKVILRHSAFLDGSMISMINYKNISRDTPTFWEFSYFLSWPILHTHIQDFIGTLKDAFRVRCSCEKQQPNAPESSLPLISPLCTRGGSAGAYPNSAQALDPSGCGAPWIFTADFVLLWRPCCSAFVHMVNHTVDQHTKHRNSPWSLCGRFAFFALQRLNWCCYGLPITEWAAMVQDCAGTQSIFSLFLFPPFFNINLHELIIWVYSQSLY